MVTARTTSAVRLILATVSLLVVGAFAGAVPASAYKEVGTSGAVGAHSLDDTRSSPGGECRYDFHNMGSAQVLERIRLDPPNLRAASGQGNQLVGWSFTIDRRAADAFHVQPGPWKTTYTSPVMKATTNANHDAVFAPASVRVYVPGSPSADAWYLYRATVNAFWYGADGHVTGTARMRLEWFQSFFGADQEKQRGTCRSWIL